MFGALSDALETRYGDGAAMGDARCADDDDMMHQLREIAADMRTLAGLHLRAHMGNLERKVNSSSVSSLVPISIKCIFKHRGNNLAMFTNGGRYNIQKVRTLRT